MRASNKKVLNVPCTVEIENSPETLHAHVELDGVEVGPGDEVIVHGAPTHVAFGEKIVARCHATVVRAGPIDRIRAKVEGYLELTELYEVGFSEARPS